MSIGPGSETRFMVTSAISKALLEQTRYVSNLKLWEQYLIWRYTLGSGALNASLIGIAKEEQITYWVYNFFGAWNYTKESIDKSFKEYTKYFENAKVYLLDKNREKIGKTIVQKVIRQLQKIIMEAPTIKTEFYVYKVSSKYPELPEEMSAMNIVNQKPFNSTTYNPQFNFAPFIAEEATCCLHRIKIKRGSEVLMIPAEYHAYPHEMECLLPFGAKFHVEQIGEAEFNYIPKEQQKFIEVQTKDNLKIGQVYMVDPVSDNKVKNKRLKYYVSELINPNTI